MNFDPSCIEIEDFLECLEIRNVTQATAEEMRYSCPFPNHSNGDENASAYMNIETTAFFCHGCKEKGNAISFTAKLLDITVLEAIRMLKSRYAPGYIDPDARNMVAEVRKVLERRDEQETPQPQLDESALDRFDTDWFAIQKARDAGEDTFGLDYMIERGFSAETLTEWEFGYDTTSQRISFAVRDFDGTLIGFKGRAIDGRQPKYLVLGDKPGKPERYGWPCYHTSRVVFGAHRVAQEPEIIICEGELNAVALWQMGKKAVAINGSYFSEGHARIIKRIADRAILFFDNDPDGEDKAGHEVTMRVIDTLSPFMPVMTVPPHHGDPASMTPAEVEDLLGQIRSSLLLRI